MIAVKHFQRGFHYAPPQSGKKWWKGIDDSPQIPTDNKRGPACQHQCARFENTSSYRCLCQVPWCHQHRHQKLESHFHRYHFWKRLIAHHGFAFLLSSSKLKWRKTADQNYSVFWKPSFSTLCTVCGQLPVVIGWGSFCYGKQAIVLFKKPSKIKERVIYDIVVSADHAAHSPIHDFWIL